MSAVKTAPKNIPVRAKRQGARVYSSFGKKRSIMDDSASMRFHRLAAAWKLRQGYSSSVAQMAMHPAYQAIIGMGNAAVPLILSELSRQVDHWFWALKAITEEDPVPQADRGNLQKMSEAWLAWGRKHGYIG